MTGLLREPPVSAIRASPTVGKGQASPIRSLVIALVAALFMAFIGAVGTGQVPLGNRLSYWLTVMITGALIGLGIAGGIHQWGRLRDRPVIEGALVTVLIALPLTVVVVMANIFFLGATAPGPIEYVVIAGVVLVVSALLTTINYAMARPALPATRTAEPVVGSSAEQMTVKGAEPPALQSRLPTHLRQARLLALQAEDHYLRVHTDRGSALILMRMGDAMTELAGIEGKRVHRSWWVARAAIVATPSGNGRTLLRLEGGLEVPVSRSSRPDLVRDGWLA